MVIAFLSLTYATFFLSCSVLLLASVLGSLARSVDAMSWSSKERTLRMVRTGRAELISLMGSSCHWCGATSVPLEFDHLFPKSWVASQLSRWQRLARYRREFKEGKIVLACKSCNCSRGRPLLGDPDF